MGELMLNSLGEIRFLITRAVKYEGVSYEIGDEVPPHIARKIDKCVKKVDGGEIPKGVILGEKEPKESFVMSLKQEAIKKKTTKTKK